MIFQLFLKQSKVIAPRKHVTVVLYIEKNLTFRNQTKPIKIPIICRTDGRKLLMIKFISKVALLMFEHFYIRIFKMKLILFNRLLVCFDNDKVREKRMLFMHLYFHL